jgi:hypothetical protein
MPALAPPIGVLGVVDAWPEHVLGPRLVAAKEAVDPVGRSSEDDATADFETQRPLPRVSLHAAIRPGNVWQFEVR